MTDHLSEADRKLCERIEAFVESNAEIVDDIADAATTIREQAAQLAKTEAIAERLAELLSRYRNETPLGNQPHMIAHKADAVLAAWAAHQING